MKTLKIFCSVGSGHRGADASLTIVAARLRRTEIISGTALGVRYDLDGGLDDALREG